MAHEPTLKDRRLAGRIPIEGQVCVKILESHILGPSRNISQEGIYFIAEAEMPVEVTLPGNGGVFKGKVVRVGAVREGELGIAIRFDEPVPEDKLPQLEG
jgi:hypothetical protein